MDHMKDINWNEIDPEILCKLGDYIEHMKVGNTEIAIKQEPGVNSCSYGLENFATGIEGQFLNQSLLSMDNDPKIVEGKPKRQQRKNSAKIDNGSSGQWQTDCSQMDIKPDLSTLSVSKKQPRKRYRTSQIDPNDKKERRKYQNREAAKTYRNNQKEKAKRIETDLDEQKKQFNNLQNEIAFLKSQLAECEKLLREHQLSGQCVLKNRQVNPSYDQSYPNASESMNFPGSCNMTGHPLGYEYANTNPATMTNRCNQPFYANTNPPTTTNNYSEPFYANTNPAFINNTDPVYSVQNPTAVFNPCDQVFSGVNYPEAIGSPCSVQSGQTEDRQSEMQQNGDNSFVGSPVSDYQFMYSPNTQSVNVTPLKELDMFIQSIPNQPALMNNDLLNDPMWSGYDLTLL